MRVSPWNRLRRALGLPYMVTLEAEDHIPSGETVLLSVEEERRIREQCGFDADYSVSISYECNWGGAGFGSDFGVSDNFSAFKT
jgi:hypothetical protein